VSSQTDFRKKSHVNTLDIAKRADRLWISSADHLFPPGGQGRPDDGADRDGKAKENLDRFIRTMIQIAKEAETAAGPTSPSPQRVKVRRLDEVQAARKPRLRWTPKE